VASLTASPHRRALLIGNAAYPDSPLSNPVHDATDLASLLRRLGFEVTLHRDADKATMEHAIDRFTQGVPRGSAGLFFFAGHGVQIEGVNYLMPISMHFNAASDVKYQAVAADWVLARMEESGMHDGRLLHRALNWGWHTHGCLGLLRITGRGGLCADAERRRLWVLRHALTVLVGKKCFW